MSSIDLRMTASLSAFLTEDHRRLDALLDRAIGTAGRIDLEHYTEFRAGLLKHIAMEEKVLIPAVERLHKGHLKEIAARLRLDHGALAALLVPTPSPQIINALHGILSSHNKLEEGQGGFYEITEQIPQEQQRELLARIRSMPAVPVMPLSTRPEILNATRRALARAGYDLDRYQR